MTWHDDWAWHQTLHNLVNTAIRSTALSHMLLSAAVWCIITAVRCREGAHITSLLRGKGGGVYCLMPSDGEVLQSTEDGIVEFLLSGELYPCYVCGQLVGQEELCCSGGGVSHCLRHGSVACSATNIVNVRG